MKFTTIDYLFRVPG